MTLTTPARFMTLHLAQRGFTDARTFMSLSPLRNYLVLTAYFCITHYVSRYLFYPLYYPTPGEVVGRKLDGYSVAWDYAGRTHPHLVAQVGEHGVSVVQLNTPHPVGCGFGYSAFDPNYVFFLSHYSGVPKSNYTTILR
jgi:hypothetical protein